jgi:hypothetical protein
VLLQRAGDSRRKMTCRLYRWLQLALKVTPSGADFAAFGPACTQGGRGPPVLFCVPCPVVPVPMNEGSSVAISAEDPVRNNPEIYYEKICEVVL